MPETEQFFDNIFNNARANGIVILNSDGMIKNVNAAFTSAYGYTTDDLKSQHFRVLFLEKDQAMRKPEMELDTTQREGSGSDENYLVNKAGIPIWVTGESVLVKTNDSTCIVKIIHNIHAQKQLERYLLHTSELLDSLFESVHQSGLLILDSRMKVIKTNAFFRTLFQIEEPVAEGAKLQQLPHPFWSGEEVKNDLRTSIVTGKSLQKEYVVTTAANQLRRLHITTKLIVGDDAAERQLLLMVKER